MSYGVTMWKGRKICTIALVLVAPDVMAGCEGELSSDIACVFKISATRLSQALLSLFKPALGFSGGDLYPYRFGWNSIIIVVRWK
jgi:hypothetical protein